MKNILKVFGSASSLTKKKINREKKIGWKMNSLFFDLDTPMGCQYDFKPNFL